MLKGNWASWTRLFLGVIAMIIMWQFMPLALVALVAFVFTVIEWLRDFLPSQEDKHDNRILEQKRCTF